MIHVIATIDLRDGKRADFLGEFHKLVPLVKAEDGCIEYGPNIDVDTGISAQVALRPNTVTVVEKWESVDHLKAHLGAPHMEAFRTSVMELIEKISIQVVEPA